MRRSHRLLVETGYLPARGPVRAAVMWRRAEAAWSRADWLEALLKRMRQDRFDLDGVLLMEEPALGRAGVRRFAVAHPLAG